MAATDGVTVIGDYDQATAGAAIDILLGLIPDSDTAPAQGGGGFLDEMNPAAAAQLRVELESMKTFINLFDAPA